LAEGRADLRQLTPGSHPDWERLNIKVAPQYIRGMHVHFPGADTLEVIDPHNYAKEYRIDRAPLKLMDSCGWSSTASPL